MRRAARDAETAGRIRSTLALSLLLATCGCEAQERRKYDAWFPPGSPRQQMITQYGQPWWTVDRPADEPTDAQWREAIDAGRQWMHPSILVEYVREVERSTSARVARFDGFNVPSHRSFLQRLDILGNWEDLVYYDASGRVLSSRPLPYYAYGD